MFFLGQIYLLYCYLLSTWIIRRSREWKTSVTRFGEISPLWNILKVFRQFFLKTFSIWQNFEPTLANSFAIGQIKGQILKNIRSIWSHCLFPNLLSQNEWGRSLFGCQRSDILCCFFDDLWIGTETRRDPPCRRTTNKSKKMLSKIGKNSSSACNSGHVPTCQPTYIPTYKPT